MEVVTSRGAATAVYPPPTSSLGRCGHLGDDYAQIPFDKPHDRES